MRLIACGLLGCAGLWTGLGCSRKKAPEQVASPPVEPVLPTAAPAALAPSGAGSADSPELVRVPSWIRALPEIDVPVKEGEQAWASAPVAGSEMAVVGVYTVERVHDKRAVLLDKAGQKARAVPGALIHPLGVRGKLKAEDTALGYSWTSAVVLGRVTKIRGDDVQLAYDWAGSTKTATMDHAEPPVRGIAPMAFVGYPKFERQSKGLLIAVSKDKGWVQTSSGHVEIHDRGELKSLDISAKALDVGDRVDGYSWTSGYEPGTVSRVLEPGLRYAVGLGPSREQPYFFADLLHR